MTDFSSTRFLRDMPAVQETISRAECSGKITAKFDRLPASLRCGDLIRFYDDIPDENGECEEAALIFFNPETEDFEYEDYGKNLISRSGDLQMVLLALKREVFRNYDFVMSCYADDFGEITRISCPVKIRGGVPEVGVIERTVRNEDEQECRRDEITVKEALKFIAETEAKKKDALYESRCIILNNCDIFREIASGAFNIRDWFDAESAQDEFKPWMSPYNLAPCGVAAPYAVLAYDGFMTTMDLVMRETGNRDGKDDDLAREFIRGRGASPENFCIIYRDFFGSKRKDYRM